MRKFLSALAALAILATGALAPAAALAVPAGVAPPASKAETKAQKFRRLMTKAATSNPAINAPLSGAWAWTASTAVNAGARFSNGGKVYEVTTAGTTAGSGGPTGYGSAITDNTVTWAYVGAQTAPTVTNATTATSGLTQTIAMSDTRLRYGGGNSVALNGGYAFWTLGNSTDTTCVSQASPKKIGTGAFVEFETDAPKITLDFKQSSYFATIIVTDLNGGPADARFVDAAPAQLEASGSGHSYLNLDFTNTGTGALKHMRRIRVDFGCSQVFFAVKIAPTDALGASPAADVIHAAFLGDSWTAGHNIFLPTTLSTSYNTTFGVYGWRVGFAETLGRLLGWDDVWASGASGTGYAQVTALYPDAFYGRVSDVSSITVNGTTYRPDVAVFMGGVNDANVNQFGTGTAITTTFEQAKCLLALQNFRASNPGVPILVLGFNNFGSSVLSLNQPYETALAACVTQFADPLTYFVPNISATDTGTSGTPVGYIFGTGRLGSATGTGNSDFYVSNGGSNTGHPNHLGMQYLAARYATKIRAIIEAATWSALDDAHWQSLAANDDVRLSEAA